MYTFDMFQRCRCPYSTRCCQVLCTPANELAPIEACCWTKCCIGASVATVRCQRTVALGVDLFAWKWQRRNLSQSRSRRSQVALRWCVSELCSQMNLSVTGHCGQ